MMSIKNKDIIILTECVMKSPVEIPVGHIIYITTRNRNTILITINGEIIVTEAFKTVREMLKERRFCRPHGSYFVNIEYVYEYTRDRVILKYNNNLYDIYMSRRYYKEFKKSLYLFKNNHFC